MANLADSLNDIGAITREERAALERLEKPARRFRRGAEIRPEADPANTLFVLKQGCVKASVGFEGGGRQIIRLNFPGDILGSAGLGYTEAIDALHAASEVEVAELDKTRFAEVFSRYPRLAMLTYLSAQNDGVRLMDRLCSLGQTPARSRVAALLITTCDRLRLQAGETGAIKIPFPFTQLEMGQMAGLSAVHVNRVVKGLVAEGVVDWRRYAVTVLDLDRLRDLALIPRRTRDPLLAWLPPSPQGSPAAALV